MTADADASPARAIASPLARYLAAVYAMLLAYGSLYPVAGWRTLAVDPVAWFLAPLPRYITGFDVAVNAFAYVPLGFLIALALFPHVRGALAVVVGCAAAGALSFALEALQSYLPSRIPSNLDFALNLFGGTLGAFAGAVLARRIVAEGRLRRLRQQWFRAGRAVDFGLMLLAVWLLTQLDPETLLFGNGDLRDLFAAVPTELHPPDLFIRIEALVSAANVIAVGLLAGALVSADRPAALVVCVLVAGALVVRSVAFATLFQPHEMFSWATRGALIGLGSGLAAVALLGRLPRPARIALAGSLLMLATVLVNLAPGNPYHAQALAVWRQGHFLNFTGLTAALSAVWPFVAMAFLLATGARQAR